MDEGLLVRCSLAPKTQLLALCGHARIEPRHMEAHQRLGRPEYRQGDAGECVISAREVHVSHRLRDPRKQTALQNGGVGMQPHPASRRDTALRSVLIRSRCSYWQICGTAASSHQYHVPAARPDRVLDAAIALSAAPTLTGSLPRNTLWMQWTGHQSSTGRTIR